MSTALDLRIGATAKRLIDRYGKPMLLKKPSVGDYDTATGTVTVHSTAYTVRGVIRDPSVFELDTSSVERGDRFVMLAATGLIAAAPQPGDILTIANDDWRAVRVNSTFSGEDVAVYELQVRR